MYSFRSLSSSAPLIPAPSAQPKNIVAPAPVIPKPAAPFDPNKSDAEKVRDMINQSGGGWNQYVSLCRPCLEFTNCARRPMQRPPFQRYKAFPGQSVPPPTYVCYRCSRTYSSPLEFGYGSLSTAYPRLARANDWQVPRERGVVFVNCVAVIEIRSVHAWCACKSCLVSVFSQSPVIGSVIVRPTEILPLMCIRLRLRQKLIDFYSMLTPLMLSSLFAPHVTCLAQCASTMTHGDDVFSEKHNLAKKAARPTH